MKSENRITLEDTAKSAMIKMSDGNPGAITTLVGLYAESSKIDPDDIFGGVGPILNLDSLGVYGSRIWELFQYVCGGSVVNVLTVMRAWQMGILSEDDVDYAIHNHGKKCIDIEEVMKKVQKRLPNFNKKQEVVNEERGEDNQASRTEEEGV